MTTTLIEFKGSSWIQRVTYDPAKQVMTVYMENGGVYPYANVERNAFINFMLSESQGEFYNKQIKGKYDLHVDQKLYKKGQEALELLKEMVGRAQTPGLKNFTDLLRKAEDLVNDK